MANLSDELKKVEAAITEARKDRDRDEIRKLNIKHSQISLAIGRGETSTVKKPEVRKPRSNKEARELAS